MFPKLQQIFYSKQGLFECIINKIPILKVEGEVLLTSKWLTLGSSYESVQSIMHSQEKSWIDVGFLLTYQAVDQVQEILVISPMPLRTELGVTHLPVDKAIQTEKMGYMTVM